MVLQEVGAAWTLVGLVHIVHTALFPGKLITSRTVLQLTHGFCIVLCFFLYIYERNYKNGYVWNDLSESDVIYPSDGVEYVLKGSEIFPGCSSGNDHYQFVYLSPCTAFSW